MFSVAEKQLSQLETSFPLAESLRVLPFATSNLQLATRAHTQDALEHMPLLLDILKMAQEPESDFLQDPERPFLETAEQPSASLQAAEETKSPL